MSLASTPDDEALSPPSYDGEDTRPTSRKELAGFYAYSFAAEVFVICGLGAFIPITLEDLARGSPSAVLASDPTRSCKTKVDIPEVAATLSAYGNHPGKHANNQCVFRLLGLEINTASFAMYTFSISVLLQALVVVTMSGAADHGKFRKSMLLTFAVVGAVATMLYLPVTPNTYLFGSLWAIIGNVCFGASFVLLNSFLPLLVRHHPKVLSRHGGRGSSRSESLNEVGHTLFNNLMNMTFLESCLLVAEYSVTSLNTHLDIFLSLSSYQIEDSSMYTLLSLIKIKSSQSTLPLPTTELSQTPRRLSCSVPSKHDHTPDLQQHLPTTCSFPPRSRRTELVLAISLPLQYKCSQSSSYNRPAQISGPFALSCL